MRKIVLLALVASIVFATVAWATTTPGVVTGGATGVSKSDAVLHATVNPGGSSTAYNFEYGPTVAYGAFSRTGHTGSASAAVPVAESLSRLAPGTLYHYRVEASNKLGSTVGRDHTFTTAGHPPPGAITGVASVLNTTTATMTGTVVTNGQKTSSYFQWGPGPTYGNQTAVANVTAAKTPTAVSFTLTGLAPGTTFHYRLVAAHAGGGLEYGADQAFTTIPLVRFGAKVTTHTTPGRARHKPYRFTTTGTVVPGVSLPPGVGCSGLVRIRFGTGHRAVAFRKVPVQSNCTYAAEVRFKHLINHRPAKLRVEVRFLGNAYLRAAGARTRRVKLG